MKKRIWRYGSFGAAFGILILLMVTAALILTGKLRINKIWSRSYEVKGVDVSHYQGNIDWVQFREQGVEFAFIKATEGSSHVDERFADNWKRADEAGLVTGAYHFFSFDSPADTQAEHYIQTAGSLKGRMIPVVDAEYYGNKKENPPDAEAVRESLLELLKLLEEHYGRKPMIYTTYPFYRAYIQDSANAVFDEYPLWIRNVYYPPVDIGREWQFWQYSDKGTLDGMDGPETYIDLNVFSGTRQDLESYRIKEEPTT